MAKILKIQLTVPPSPELVHRFQNFGEDVYGALRVECEVSIDEIDSATHTFHVRKIHKRFVRTAAATVRKISAEHHLAELVTVEEITLSTKA